MGSLNAVCLAVCLAGVAPIAVAQTAGLGLSPEERLAKNAAYMQSQAYRDADRNHDGRLSREEWLDRDWGFLLIYDSDGDGRLSMTEFVALHCGPPAAPGTGSQRMYEACRKSQYGAFGPKSRAPGFEITRDSFRSRARQEFRWSDRNHDGFVDEKDKLRAAR